MFKRFFYEYFYFARKERNGILLLLSILFILLITHKGSSYIFGASRIDFKEFQADVDKFEKSLRSQKYNPIAEVKTSSSVSNTSLFFFDPNKLDESGWIKLGLTNKQVKTLLNFRNKGGHFYKKEDLRKIYSISDENYKRFEPWVVIDQEINNKNTQVANNLKSNREVIQVDLNIADSALLTSLKGVGPVLARRIIQYRNRLGGFYAINQLKEVYGIDSANFEKLVTQMKLTTNQLDYLYINTASIEEMKKHPYLGYKIASAIVNYRNQHGPFNHIDELRNIVLIKAEIFSKIEPYLRL